MKMYTRQSGPVNIDDIALPRPVRFVIFVVIRQEERAIAAKLLVISRIYLFF